MSKYHYKHINYVDTTIRLNKRRIIEELESTIVDQQKIIIEQQHLVKIQLQEIELYKSKLELYKIFVAENNIDNICCICLEKTDLIKFKKTLECKHSYHKHCLKLLKNKLCPICREYSHRF